MTEFSRYFDRRDEFLTAYKQAGSEILRQTLLQALFDTDLCMATFLDFLLALKGGTERIGNMREEFEKRKLEAAARIEQMRIIIARTLEEQERTRDKELQERAATDESLKKLYEEFQAQLARDHQLRVETLAISLQAYESANFLQAVMIGFSAFILNLKIDEVSNSLFEGIFKGRTSEHVTEAIIHIINYFIGISPIGWFTDAIQTIRNIYFAQIDEITTMDDGMKYLETYLVAARQWSVTGQVAIDTINWWAQDTLMPLQVSESRARVQERREALSVNWDYQTGVLSRD